MDRTGHSIGHCHLTRRFTVVGAESLPDLPFGNRQAANRKITSDLSDDVLIAVDLEVCPVDRSGIGGKISVLQAEEAAGPKAGENVPTRDYAVTGVVVETPG